MNYWLIYNGVKLGPLSPEQVRAMHLDPTTPTWRTGMPDWGKAEDFPELLDTLAMPQVPPQVPYVAPGPYAFQQPEQPLQEERPMPSSHLAWAIICTLLCCLPFGVVAIVYATQVESRYRSGDYNGAVKASDNAQIWIIVAIVAGLLMVPVQLVMALM